MNTLTVDVAVIGAGTAGSPRGARRRQLGAVGAADRGRPVRHDLRAGRLHALEAADRRGRGRPRTSRAPAASASACRTACASTGARCWSGCAASATASSASCWTASSRFPPRSACAAGRASSGRPRCSRRPHPGRGEGGRHRHRLEPDRAAAARKRLARAPADQRRRLRAPRPAGVARGHRHRARRARARPGAASPRRADAFFSRSARLGPLTDPACRRWSRPASARELDLQLAANRSVERDGGVRFRLGWTDAAGAVRESAFERVLVATGRHAEPRRSRSRQRPARRQRAVDRSGTPCSAATLPIFVAGDASADRPVLHEAPTRGRIAGSNAAPSRTSATPYGARRSRSSSPMPQMAIVGGAYRDLDPPRSRSAPSRTPTRAARRHGRERGPGAPLRRIAIRGTLLGAEMFGPRVEHTAHLLAWAVQRRVTVERGARACRSTTR